MSGTSITLAAESGGASLSSSNVTFVIVAVVFALVALGFAAAFVRSVLAAGRGTTTMQDIAGAVQEGATAYLFRQFRTLAIFVVIAVVLLFLLPVHNETGSEVAVKIGRSLFFIVGALFSSTIGGAGMALATRANLRVAAAAGEQGGRERAMGIAFRTGGVVGFLTVGFGLFGGALVVLIYRGNAPTVLEGFGFGAALLAMFMRVGGGIFTKAADVGADLVGKVEQGIPEDDPRNAATIADNVGDNVGDCAGMAADLFESYAVTLVAALILGSAAFGERRAGLPADRLRDRRGHRDRRRLHHPAACRRPSGLTAINRAFYISAVLVRGPGRDRLRFVFLPASFAGFGGRRHRRRGGTAAGTRSSIAIGAVVIGIVLAAGILALTGYFTETEPAAGAGHRQDVADRSGHGHPRPASASASSRPSTPRSVIAAGRVRRVPARRCVDHAVAVRGGARRHRPAHHGRRDRGDGHVRPDLRQRAGHRRDVRRRRRGGRADPHRARRGRQHHQGDHQGHRDRHGRARRDGAVRLVHRHGRRARWPRRAPRPASSVDLRTC